MPYSLPDSGPSAPSESKPRRRGAGSGSLFKRAERGPGREGSSSSSTPANDESRTPTELVDDSAERLRYDDLTSSAAKKLVKEARKISRTTTASAQRSQRIAEETRELAGVTLEALYHQGQQLDNVGQ